MSMAIETTVSAKHMNRVVIVNSLDKAGSCSVISVADSHWLWDIWVLLDIGWLLALNWCLSLVINWLALNWYLALVGINVVLGRSVDVWINRGLLSWVHLKDILYINLFFSTK